MRDDILTSDALKILDTIEQKGSFASAAQALYRVPSAITYAVQKLEEELGIALFKKEGRRAVMTPAARLLVREGREILSALQQLQRSALEVDSGWEPVINIAVNSILGLEFIYPVIADFYRQHPHIEINLHEEVLTGSWEAIINERVDLIVDASNEPPKQQYIRVKKIGQTNWIFCAAPQHPLAKQRLPLDIARLADYRIVVVRDSARELAPLSQRVFSTLPVLSVPTMRDKIEAIQHNLGAGFLPEDRIQEALASGEIVSLTVNDKIAKSNLYLAWRNKNKGKALNWFISRLNLSQN